jgi:hypothetical protein
MLDKVGRLRGPIIGIDRHAARANAVEGQLVKDVVGMVLQQRRHAMAEAIACRPVDRRQRIDAPAGLTVGNLESRR